MNEVLTAILTSPNRIDIISAATGAVKRSITIDGTLQNGPIVVGDMCTLTIDQSNNSRVTRIYNMNTGAITKTFQTTY
jgi:hypothetical protein